MFEISKTSINNVVNRRLNAIASNVLSYIISPVFKEFDRIDLFSFLYLSVLVTLASFVAVSLCAFIMCFHYSIEFLSRRTKSGE